MSEVYIGLMSGTSVDGIDAVLVDFTQPLPAIIATHYEKMPAHLRQSILELCESGMNEIERMGALDVALGKQFATAAKTLLQKSGISANTVRAIGHHGQTIRHRPDDKFTLQIGDANIVAAETGITTVADFRRRDLAFAGQGAPLVPAFHQFAFADNQVNRAILNIGGIANVTLLKKSGNDPIIGFDTGPGNLLLDAWVNHHLQQPYDKEGAWAKTGTINTALLKQLLNDPFFKLPAPKSTGREYFNLKWLQSMLPTSFNPADIQATLVELTAQSIILAISSYMTDGEILVCGGGAHNEFLMQRLQALTSKQIVASTQKLGMDPDWVEAIAFAWLAKQTLHKKPGNLPSVTGANKSTILGGVYYT